MYAKGKKVWDKQSEKVLLLTWSKYIGRLRGNRRNSPILAEMTKELNDQGVQCTSLEVKTKLHNLTNRYRKEKRGIKKKYKPEPPDDDGWDVVKEMDEVFKPKSKNSECLVYDSINNINSSIKIDPLSSSMNTSSSFASMLKSPAASPTLVNPPDSPFSIRSCDSSSDTSLPAERKRKKEFDTFFENLEQTMDNINKDIKITIEKIINIEEEKKEILKEYVKREAEVQVALLEFLRRN